MEWILEPWPWFVSGPLIALVMFTLLFFGKNFGMSSNLRTMCTIGGGGKFSEFFKFDWKSQRWNLLVVMGAVFGGYIASNHLSNSTEIELSQSTIKSLEERGFQNIGESYVPAELFDWENVLTIPGILIMLIGGILVGFGARYAGGCTSGHAISGLSNLQLPSLIAVLGFFAGGLLMTHFILPYIL